MKKNQISFKIHFFHTPFRLPRRRNQFFDSKLNSDVEWVSDLNFSATKAFDLNELSPFRDLFSPFHPHSYTIKGNFLRPSKKMKPTLQIFTIRHQNLLTQLKIDFTNEVENLSNRCTKLTKTIRQYRIRTSVFVLLPFLYAFISFTFQGWIQYRAFCSGRTPGALVKTIRYSKFRIIFVISVCNLTLPLTLPYFLLYLTSYLIIPYVLLYFTIPYLKPTLCLTLPYILTYLTFYFTLPYLMSYLTIPYLTSYLALLNHTIPYLSIPYFLPCHLRSYLTLRLTLPYLTNLTSYLTLPYLMSYLTILYLTSYLTLPYLTLPYLTIPYILSYLTLCLTLPYLKSYLTLPYILCYLTSYLTIHLMLPYVLPYLTLHLTSYLTLH